MKKHNFSAGPAILPASVMEEAAQAVRNLNGSGLSILEISHRSKAFVAILEEAESLVRELLDVSDNYAVLFLTGGASTQFFLAPMNLLNKGDKAGYINTGTWSNKAIKEAHSFGDVVEVASSKDQKYSCIPKGYTIDSDLKYLHITSNNTVAGTQFAKFPDTDVPLVADMSSDIFSRHLDINRYAVIYAGAQKNMGPAGTALVIVRKDLLGKVARTIPTMLDYRTHIEKGSSFNTPPVFPIFVSMLTLKWVKEQGGIDAMIKINAAKAAVLYNEIDTNPLFKSAVSNKTDRSLMNVTFVLESKYSHLQDDFLAAAAAVGCEGIKGHRSVGGFRASIYNSMPIKSVEVLVGIMKDFAAKH